MQKGTIWQQWRDLPNTMKPEKTDLNNVSVIGAGSWGTALAILLGRKGVKTLLWGRRPEFVDELARHRENRTYLPGHRFPDSLRLTSDLREAVTGADTLLFVVPSHGMRTVATKVAEILNTQQYSSLPKAVVFGSKGIENDTLLTMSELLEQVLPESLTGRIACLSGPSFAEEVACSMPTAVTVAAPEHRLAERLQSLFSTDYFRVYASVDLIGVQLGGALKNVMAIAAGISDGLGFGHNSRAALITRGLAEMARLGVQRGANPLTFAGLAGLGDLVLTCTGDLSRNRQVGLKLGQGLSIEQILDEMKMVAEGVKTSKSAYQMAQRFHVDMPITVQVYKVLYQGLDPRDAVKELLTRPLKQEL